jgi:mannosyltransferase OCH1-like enzyme
MIPKIIHQVYWDFYGDNKEIPEVWKDYHLTWKQKFPEPEYEHLLWDLEKSTNLIKEHYPQFLETFKGYPKHIQRADSVRYFILQKYGGIYADLDCEVRVNFYDKLDAEKINIVQSCYYDDRLMNCLMASPEGVELWKKVFIQLKEKSVILSTLESTGPRLISSSFDPKDINILDYDNFNPLKERAPIYGMIENMFFTSLDSEKSKNWENAYVVHHGTESWRDEEIKTNISHNWIYFVLIGIIILFSLYLFYNKKWPRLSS